VPWIIKSSAFARPGERLAIVNDDTFRDIGVVFFNLKVVYRCVNACWLDFADEAEAIWASKPI
jgi:hypothetical protein